MELRSLIIGKDINILKAIEEFKLSYDIENFLDNLYGILDKDNGESENIVPINKFLDNELKMVFETNTQTTVTAPSSTHNIEYHAKCEDTLNLIKIKVFYDKSLSTSEIDCKNFLKESKNYSS